MRALLATALLATTLALSALPARALEVTAAGVTVSNAWVRATPGGVTNGAAYLEVKAASGVSDRLVAVSSSASSRAELHTHAMDGDVMRMRRVDAIAVKDAAPAILKPHGDHVMLLDLKAPLKEGDSVKLTLTFEKAGPIEVEARVEAIGAAGPKAAGATASDHGAHHKH